MEKTYPSVELVYPIAVASYDAALRRLDTIDGRLQTVLAFIVHWLRQETWDFQKNFIAYAGDAFEANLSLVDRKWRSTVTLILIFCAQTVALLVWVAARRF